MRYLYSSIPRIILTINGYTVQDVLLSRWFELVYGECTVKNLLLSKWFDLVRHVYETPCTLLVFWVLDLLCVKNSWYSQSSPCTWPGRRGRSKKIINPKKLRLAKYPMSPSQQLFPPRAPLRMPGRNSNESPANAGLLQEQTS